MGASTEDFKSNECSPNLMCFSLRICKYVVYAIMYCSVVLAIISIFTLFSLINGSLFIFSDNIPGISYVVNCFEILWLYDSLTTTSLIFTVSSFDDLISGK